MIPDSVWSPLMERKLILYGVFSVQGATVPTPSQLLDILELLGRGDIRW